MPKLTQKVIDNRKPVDKEQEILRDDELIGFGVRFTANSSSYIVECRLNGKNKRVTLGKTSLLSLEDARTKARQTLALMSAGVDPDADNVYSGEIE